MPKQILILLFIFSYCASTISQNLLPNSNSIKSIKVVTYNLFYGLTLSPGKSGDNLPQEEKFIDWILIENPDIIAYQELGSTYDSESELSQLASKINHNFAYVWDRGSKQSIGITSKWEMELVDGDNTYEGHVVYKIKNEPFYFIITHLSSSNINKRKNETDLILSKFQNYVNNNNHVVILGDFNSNTENDAIYLNNNISERLKERFDKGNKFNSELSCTSNSDITTCDWDYSVMPKYLSSNLDIIDLIDNYADKEGYKANKMWGTFPSKAVAAVATKAQRSRHLSRIDYILSNQTLSNYTKDARIVHSYINSNNEYIEMDEISDHYPILTQFTTEELGYKSSTSDIIFDSNFVSPQNILGTNYRATDLVSVSDNYGNGNFYNLTKDNAIKIASFKLRDGGINDDDDNFPTILNHINFEISNYHVLDKIAIYQNDVELDERKVNHHKVFPDSKIAFSNLGIIAEDNQEVSFDIWVTFNNPVNEKTQFKVEIKNCMSDFNSSHFSSPDGGNAESSTNGDDNTVLSEGLNYNYNDKNSYRFYPNPSKNYINIISNSNFGEIKIFSGDGKNIMNHSIEKGKKRLNISHLKKGAYIINYVLNNNTHSELLFKM